MPQMAFQASLDGHGSIFISILKIINICFSVSQTAQLLSSCQTEKSAKHLTKSLFIQNVVY